MNVMNARRLVCVGMFTLTILGALLLALGAAAQPESAPEAPASSAAPPPAAPGSAAPGAEAPSPEALASAKELFKSGVTLFNAGDMERALDYFLRSRAAFPSAKNTINAAICLDRLGRFDEALELYEEVLTKFGADLDEASRVAIAPAMTALRSKVGSINVSANVEGAVLVDGRSRGKLPLTAPLRVLAGKHVVRVLKDGYATSETTVKVDIGQVVAVDLTLKALAAAGVLRVEDPQNEGAEVFVDRVGVGTVPWEGTLGPGKHLVWTKKGDLGTGPTEVTVVQGQTVLARLKSTQLGAPARIEPVPATAEVVIDGTVLGPGVWEGRLPVGAREVMVREPGYFAKTEPVSVPPPGGSPVKMRVVLAIDRSHPRWPKAGPSGKFGVGIHGGYLWTTSLKSGAGEACPAHCSGNDRARGFLAGLRGSYRFPFGVAIEAGVGYLSLSASFSRILDAKFGPKIQNPDGDYSVRYYLDDKLYLSGPLATVGGSYRLEIGKRFSMTGRALAGILFTRSTDAMTAGARDPYHAPITYGIAGGGDPAHSVGVLVWPEVAAGFSFGPLEIGAAFGALLFINDGPTIENGKLQAPDTTVCQDTTDPNASKRAECAPTSTIVRNERGYGGGLLALTPQITATYTF